MGVASDGGKRFSSALIQSKKLSPRGYAIVVDLSFDFGVIIAYLVPGLILLRGVSGYIPAVELRFSRLDTEGSPLAPLFSLCVAAVLTGMMLSIVRFATVDASFAWSFGSGQDYWGAVERVDVNYAVLAESGRLGAYLEAKTNELRPYQFYGNTLLAATVFALSRAISAAASRGGSVARRLMRIGLWILAMSVAAAFLYPASRLSYYRFNQGVKAINVEMDGGQHEASQPG